VAGVFKPTGWIRIRHASLRLIAVGSALPLVDLGDLTGELPVAGDAARSSVSLANLKVHGMVLLRDFRASLAWQAPVLSLNPAAATLLGMHCQVAGKLALRSGLPLLLEVQVPRQSPSPFSLPGGGQATAEQLACSGQFRGLAMAPASWQGDWVAESATVSIQTGDHHGTFDRSSCYIALRGGALSCVDARLVGDELSLLGNATLLADGRAAGVVRLVAPDEAVFGIVKRLFPTTAAIPALTPMATPQRVACDLEGFGNLSALQVRLGQNGPIVPLPLPLP